MVMMCSFVGMAYVQYVGSILVVMDEHMNMPEKYRVVLM